MERNWFFKYVVLVFALTVLGLCVACGGGGGDGSEPEVSSTAPLNLAVNVPVNSKIAARFSELMNYSTINTESFLVTGPGTTPVLGTVAYVGYTATFTPMNSLTIATLYTATITTSVRDLAGNSLISNYEWTFNSGDTMDIFKPRVSSTVPTNHHMDIKTNSKLSIAFSEYMDPETITTSTFLVTGSATNPVLGTVISTGYTATFTPTNGLVADTEYTATITTGAKDLSGNSLATDYVWTFTGKSGSRYGSTHCHFYRPYKWSR
ncbi:MAG: Ig-like domain-containing protein [Planctomycetota bacterium]|nr:Ig-like domain-containing protein [Planctomycetota bacterium]